MAKEDHSNTLCSIVQRVSAGGCWRQGEVYDQLEVCATEVCLVHSIHLVL
jgi:hypothetical protein